MGEDKYEPAFMPGTLDMLVLKAVSRGPMHGYSIAQFIQQASNEVLVNALSMMSPFGPREKQALLEAPDLKARAEALVAITEIELARAARGDGSEPTLQ